MMTTNNNNGRDLQEISRKMGLEVGPEVGPMTWYEAQDYCKSLGEGWRLPTNDELRSWSSSIDLVGSYWSSFEYSNTYPDLAWYFIFPNGAANYDFKTNTHYVRAVRELPKVELPTFNQKLVGLAYTMVIGPCQGGFGYFFKHKDHEYFEDEEQLVTFADSTKVVLSAEKCHVVIFPSEVEENMFGTIERDNAHVEIHSKWSTVTYKGYGLEVANLVVNHLQMLMDETERVIFEIRCETSKQEYYDWLEKRTGYRPE